MKYKNSVYNGNSVYYYDIETVDYSKFENKESKENRIKRYQMEKAIERSNKIDKILS